MGLDEMCVLAFLQVSGVGRSRDAFKGRSAEHRAPRADLTASFAPLLPYPTSDRYHLRTISSLHYPLHSTQADNAVLADHSTKKSGSVATLALIHSLDTPHALPYHSSSLISLTIAHLGDTRALLASTSGRVQALTENHHGDSRVESERLRQSGTGIVTDSFGESRWGGTLANTRGIGDREFKTLGVIGEPEVTKRVLKGECRLLFVVALAFGALSATRATSDIPELTRFPARFSPSLAHLPSPPPLFHRSICLDIPHFLLLGDEWSFLVLFSDGISDAMSDQEVVDLCRGIKDPTQAAKKIVSFAEDVGG